MSAFHPLRTLNGIRGNCSITTGQNGAPVRFSLSFIVLGTALLAIPAARAAPADAAGRYHVVHGWPQIPDNEMLDEVSAVAVDKEAKVFVLTRGGRKWPDNDQFDTSPIVKPTIWVFDGKDGRLLKRLGTGVFALPHSITIDNVGNIWVADVALDQVFKLSPRGERLLTLGQRAVASDDNRVVEFDPTGRFLRTWGKKGVGPGEFNLPHAIAVDRRGRVFVNDRGNSRIQCFDGEGHFLFEWKGPPFVNPQDVAIGPTGRAYVTQTGDEGPPDEAGVLVLASNGSVVERVGRFGNYDGQFVDPHWVAVDSNEDIYVADFTGRRVQKFVRR
jgi:peptidylamidoglycolate lyase